MSIFNISNPKMNESLLKLRIIANIDTIHDLNILNQIADLFEAQKLLDEQEHTFYNKCTVCNNPK